MASGRLMDRTSLAARFQADHGELKTLWTTSASLR
jgi:hypothetical protein